MRNDPAEESLKLFENFIKSLNFLCFSSVLHKIRKSCRGPPEIWQRAFYKDQARVLLW